MKRMSLANHSNGRFVDRDDVTGRRGTIHAASYHNAVQDELLNALASAGLEENEGDLTQLAQAIALRASQRIEEFVAVSPEMYGAAGDGQTPDGAALARMVEVVNSLPLNVAPVIVARGNYNIMGGAQLNEPLTNEPGPGEYHGIPPIIRPDVTIDQRGAQMIVPAGTPWRRLTQGGDALDYFVSGWSLRGNNCHVLGGSMRGNLTQREVTRGPLTNNFGGNEYGIGIYGARCTVTNTDASEWGTDCVLIRGQAGEIIGGRYERGRRNNISVVPIIDGSPARPFVLRGVSFLQAGDYDEDERNDPGAGLQLERTGNFFYAVIEQCIFSGNVGDGADVLRKGLQLSHGATGCIVDRNTFFDDMKIQLGHGGGHRITNNTFIGEATIDVVDGTAALPPSLFQRNSFETTDRLPINPRDGAEYHRIGLDANTAPFWPGEWDDVPESGAPAGTYRIAPDNTSGFNADDLARTQTMTSTGPHLVTIDFSGRLARAAQVSATIIIEGVRGTSDAVFDDTFVLRLHVTVSRDAASTVQAVRASVVVIDEATFDPATDATIVGGVVSLTFATAKVQGVNTSVRVTDIRSLHPTS